MILTGLEILKQVQMGKIHLNPFVRQNINPNSYDFRLGEKLRIYTESFLDPKKFSQYQEIKIPAEGYLLEPGKIYLGHTVEEMGSDFFVPLIQAKSSLGRLGLSICLNSGFGDIGFKKQWTLLLTTLYPIKVYVNMNIGQIYFFKSQGRIVLYKGVYQESSGPMVSQMWQEFSQN